MRNTGKTTQARIRPIAKQRLEISKIRANKYESLEDLLLKQIRVIGLPDPVRELRFDKSRRWRFDFAWPEIKFAVEVQGGTFLGTKVSRSLRAQSVTQKNGVTRIVGRSGGAHNRGAGYNRDCQKLGSALILGWSVYYCDCILVRNGGAIKIIESLVNTGFDKYNNKQ